MGLEAGSTCAEGESGAEGMPGAGGAFPDPMGVVELLFRGHSIADMAEAAEMPVVAIARALSEHNFDHLRHLHKALVLGREFKLERLRLEAAEKLAQMAAALLDDHPRGLTADQVRATDAQRRAILSILRLPAFPCLADGRADMRPPANSPANSRTNWPASSPASQRGEASASDPDQGDDDDQPWRLYNQILSKRLSLAMTEVMGRGRAAEREPSHTTGGAGPAASSAGVDDDKTDDGGASRRAAAARAPVVAASSTSSSSDAGAARGPENGHDPASSAAAGEPVSGAPGTTLPERPDGNPAAPTREDGASPTIELSDETGEAGISGAAASGMAGGRTGQGLPMGLNRAARRRWLREQRAPNKRHSRPPP